MTYGLDYVAFTSAEWEWRSRGACDPSQDDIFFGDTAKPPAEAVRICVYQCKVAAQCFAYAMNQKYPVQGVWGGTSEAQRRRAAKGLPPLAEVDLEKCPAGIHDTSRVVPRTRVSTDGSTTWGNGRRCLECEKEQTRARREKVPA